MLRPLLAVTSLLLPATALADEPEAEEETISYRHQTLTADALGIALLVGGGFAEGDNGRDTGASDTLFAAGALTTFLATPVIHWSRGHHGRAVGSLLMRWGAASVGGVLAMSMNSDCHKPDDEGFENFLCELDYVGYGIVGGLVVASAIDAAFMTDERVEKAPTWAPTVTANQQGFRAGFALRF